LRTSELYEPFIERNLNAIPDVVRAYRDEHGSDETFLAVARFAVLAYAPSQHAKHALLCCLAAHDLRDSGRFDDVVTECAIYTASSRQPWSEPPLLNPPEVDVAPGSFDDRISAEKWLAARLGSPSLEREYFDVATRDFDDFGHKLIISLAAWRLSTILGEQGRYATLRIGLWEDVAYGGEPYREKGGALDQNSLRDRLVAQMVADEGSLESAHAVFLFDTAMQAPAFVRPRVFDYLTSTVRTEPIQSGGSAAALLDVPVYRLARDLGQCLIAHAAARRLDAPAIIGAAHYNLEHAPSLEEWSFA